MPLSAWLLPCAFRTRCTWSQSAHLLRVWDEKPPECTRGHRGQSRVNQARAFPSHPHPWGRCAGAQPPVELRWLRAPQDVGAGYVGAVPPCPTSGHAPAPFWGAQGCVGQPQQARGPRSGARRGTRSPSCRPGVSNEWYELPARPLIASSKSLNELLLRRAACAQLVATAAVPAWHPSWHSRHRTAGARWPRDRHPRPRVTVPKWSWAAQCPAGSCVPAWRGHVSVRGHVRTEMGQRGWRWWQRGWGPAPLGRRRGAARAESGFSVPCLEAAAFPQGSPGCQAPQGDTVGTGWYGPCSALGCDGEGLVQNLGESRRGRG